MRDIAHTAYRLRAPCLQPDPSATIPGRPHLRSVQPRLHVEDLQRAIAFYMEVLGFDIGAVFPAERPTFALLERDTVGLQLGGAEAVRAPGDRSTCTLWIETDDARALHEGLAGRVTVEWGLQCTRKGDESSPSVIGMATW